MEIGFQPCCVPEGGLGLVQFSEVPRGNSKIVMEAGVCPVQVDGPFEMGHGTVELASFDENASQVVMAHRVIGGQLRRSTVSGGSILLEFHPAENGSHLEVGVNVIRRKIRRFPVQGQGFLEFSKITEASAPKSVRDPLSGQQACHLLVNPGCVGGTPQLLQDLSGEQEEVGGSAFPGKSFLDGFQGFVPVLPEDMQMGDPFDDQPRLRETLDLRGVFRVAPVADAQESTEGELLGKACLQCLVERGQGFLWTFEVLEENPKIPVGEAA